MSPVIRIVPMGNVGNRMLQYMAAFRLKQLVPDAIIEQVHLPEWNLVIAKSRIAQRLLLVDKTRKFDLVDLSEQLRSGAIDGVVLQDYLQDVRFFRDPSDYKTLFRPNAADVVDLPKFTRNDLVINIRGGEIMRGIDHYPLIPVAFYRSIVERTGLTPVITGQLDNGAYCTELRKAFPDADFIPSQGVIRDFQMIRSAHNIVPSVSTFSWLAAWLSEAFAIHQPLLGFYNPSNSFETNLVPLGDPRWNFYLFPICYGLPEAEMLEYHKTAGVNWTRMADERISYIIQNRPFLKRKRSLESRSVDSKWYILKYPAAALEISEGWYEDAQHHYEAVGRLRGYHRNQVAHETAMPEFDTMFMGENLALGRPTLQSSVSAFSNAPTTAEDSAGAVNGNLKINYGFHTDEEDFPWWHVELERTAHIEAVVVYNRIEHPLLAQRAAPLSIQFSDDGVTWTTRFTSAADALIEGVEGKPLVWRPDQAEFARFVRLQVQRRSYLHLVEVQVFGALLGA